MKSKKEIYWEKVHHRGNMRRILWSLELGAKARASGFDPYSYLAFIKV